MEKRKSCKLLTQDEYAEVYSTFKKDSQQDDIVRNAVIKFVLQEFGSKSIDMMSIGPGTGWLEDDLIKHPQLKIKNLLAIESNPCHVEKLKEKSLNWKNISFEIDPSCFDEGYATEKRFDIVMMIHIVYYLKHPIDAIIKAKSLLKPGGKLIMFIQGEKGGCQLVYSIRAQTGRQVPSISNYNWITDAYVVDVLKRKNILCSVHEFIDFHDLTDFIERKETPGCNDTISFFLQTKYEDIDEEFRDEVYQRVKKLITVTENNKCLFGHSSNFVVVQ